MFIRRLFESILDMPGEFAEVAMHVPLCGVLLAIGGIMTALAVGYFSLLSLASILSAITPDPGGQPRKPSR
jgi:hypothetical protein